MDVGYVMSQCTDHSLIISKNNYSNIFVSTVSFYILLYNGCMYSMLHVLSNRIL